MSKIIFPKTTLTEYNELKKSFADWISATYKEEWAKASNEHKEIFEKRQKVNFNCNWSFFASIVGIFIIAPVIPCAIHYKSILCITIAVLCFIAYVALIIFHYKNDKQYDEYDDQLYKLIQKTHEIENKVNDIGEQLFGFYDASRLVEFNDSYENVFDPSSINDNLVILEKLKKEKDVNAEIIDKDVVANVLINGETYETYYLTKPIKREYFDKFTAQIKNGAYDFSYIDDEFEELCKKVQDLKNKHPQESKEE